MYVPIPTTTNGVVELPVFAALLGSISVTVAASIALSSVSFPPIKETTTSVSSGVVFPKSFTAIGASFTGVTVISNVPGTVAVPSVTL